MGLILWTNNATDSAADELVRNFFWRPLLVKIKFIHQTCVRVQYWADQEFQNKIVHIVYVCVG